MNPQLILTPGSDMFILLEQKSLNVELQHVLERMVDKLIDLKPIDMEHKFRIHKLQYKTHFMTLAFSSTAGVIGILLSKGLCCVKKKRGKGAQTWPQNFNSRVTMSRLLSEEKSSEPNQEDNQEGMDERKGTNKKSRVY